MMKKLIAALSIIGVALSGSVIAEINDPGGIGGLESLRGTAVLEVTRPADELKSVPKDQVLESDYVYQPR